MAMSPKPKADIEGPLLYKPPPSKSKSAKLGFLAAGDANGTAKYRWFKLKANLLFIFPIPSTPQSACDVKKPPSSTEPIGVLVLEHFHIQREDFESNPNTFSLIFANEPSRRHLLTAADADDAYRWTWKLGRASISGLRDTIKDLQKKLSKKLQVSANHQQQQPQHSAAGEGAVMASTSKLLTTANTQLHKARSESKLQDSQTGLQFNWQTFDDGGPSPKPKPRRKKVGSSPQHASSNMTSLAQKPPAVPVTSSAQAVGVTSSAQNQPASLARPPPRTAGFQLHAQQDFEQSQNGCPQLSREPRPTTEWHTASATDDVPVANLLDL